MTSLSTQEIYNSGFNAGKIYALAMEYADRYSSDKEPDKDYDLLDGVIRNLRLAIKHTELASAENQMLKDEMAKWLPVYETAKVKYDESIIPLDDEIEAYFSNKQGQ